LEGNNASPFLRRFLNPFLLLMYVSALNISISVYNSIPKL
jgi:hypothetical protein